MVFEGNLEKNASHEEHPFRRHDAFPRFGDFIRLPFVLLKHPIGESPVQFMYREISDSGIPNDTSRTVEYPIGESRVTLHVSWNIREGNLE